MSVELHPENSGDKKEGLSISELGVGIVVAAATAYITLARIIPQTDAYIVANIAPKVAGILILWSRVGAALIISSAGTGAAWSTSRLQKK